MQKGSAEFIELQEQFERDVKRMPFRSGRIERVKRDENVPAGVFYHDGSLNNLFVAYMNGYEFAKSLARDGVLQ